MSGETGAELHNQPEAFDYLTQGEQKRLTDWIKENLEPIKSFNEKHTSYGLKAIYAKKGGVHIGNGAFKGAMLKCGFKVKDTTTINWVFNISEKSKGFQSNH